MTDEKYKSYANDVLSGKVVSCTYIKLACRRYLDQFSKVDRYFDSEAVESVINFLQKLRQSTGKFSGKPLVLQEWQKWVVYSIFGFKRKKDNLRVVREVYIEVARKCGKSTFAAGILLYLFVADNEREAQVVFAANSFQQAQLAFTMSSNFVSNLDKKGKFFKRYRDQIRFPSTKSIMKVVSADATKLDGLNVSAFCLDEYHAATNNDVLNVLSSSTGMRTQPLQIYITTAGFDLSSPCYQLRETFLEVLRGNLSDDSIFAVIYTLDEEDDIEDPENWIKCQPNLGLTVTEDYIRSELIKAKNSPNLLTNFKTKTLNIWCSNKSGEWIPNSYIRNCTRKVDIGSSAFKGCVGYLGIDLSSTTDITAISLMIPLNGKFYFKYWFYLPKKSLMESENRDKYKYWNEQGLLTLTDDEVVDYNKVIEDIQDINREIPIEIISYDSWQSTMAITNLKKLGFNCETYSQTAGSMNKPTSFLEIITRKGDAVFDDNSIILWMFGNCEIFEDHNGNRKPVKKNKSSKYKIDGIHAILNALGVYLDNPEQDYSIIGTNY